MAKQLRNQGIGRGKHLDAPARIAGDDALGQRLDGKEVMLVPAGEAEEVAGHEEVRDLAATVGMNGKSAQDTRNDAVPALGAILLAVDRLSTLISPDRRKRCKKLHQIAVGRSAQILAAWIAAVHGRILPRHCGLLIEPVVP